MLLNMCTAASMHREGVHGGAITRVFACVRECERVDMCVRQTHRRDEDRQADRQDECETETAGTYSGEHLSPKSEHIIVRH